MTLLEAKNLGKHFSVRRRGRRQMVRAVDDVSFTLEAGKTLALVGESGAGKSTAARMVLRLIEPDHGTINFKGVDLRSLSPRELRSQRRHMQMIFQDPQTSLDPHFKIGRSLEEPLKVHFDLTSAERHARVNELLGKVRLDESVLERYPTQLSGGQLQRISIARALCTSPDLLVCDEPVSSLDYSIGAQIINLLLDLQESENLGLLFISHDLRLVRVIADEVLVMRNGTIVEHGPTEQIFETPTQPFTKELLTALPGAHN
jgi:oligopeptide transport system ATP-binding protein